MMKNAILPIALLLWPTTALAQSGAEKPTTLPTLGALAEPGTKEMSESGCVVPTKGKHLFDLRTLTEAESDLHACETDPNKPNCDEKRKRPNETKYRELALLTATLANPPRTRVTLNIVNGRGERREILWDPAAPEGIQQSILLPPGEWTLRASAEEQLIQTQQVALVLSTIFSLPVAPAGSLPEITLKATQYGVVASAAGGVKRTPLTDQDGAHSKIDDVLPTITVRCQRGTVAMDQLILDPRRAAAASTARGLLDQSIPAPVSEVMSLLGEIAVERAKAGAMELMRNKFVTPMCNKLTLRALRLDVRAISMDDEAKAAEDDKERALPRTCALLENMRLDDVLSSGKDLVTAVRDDVRLTIAPRLIDHLPSIGPQTRALALVALDFANRIIDGESTQVAEVDLLVALLDRLVFADGLVATPDVVAFVEQWLAKLNKAHLPEFRRLVVERALPPDFGDDGVVDGETPLRPWQQVQDGKGNYVCKLERTSSKFYFNAVRKQCIDAIVTKLGGGDWLAQGAALLPRTFLKQALRLMLRDRPAKEMRELVDLLKSNKLFAEAVPAKAQGIYCGGRLVIAVAKWCSRQQRCSAGDIAKIIDTPWQAFSRPSGDSLDAAMCANETNRWFVDFPNHEKYISLASTLVSFLEPVPAGQARARTVAMVRWMFDFIATQSDDSTHLDELEEVIGRLVDGDYVRAMTESVALVKAIRCPAVLTTNPDTLEEDDKCPAGLTKAMQLIGSVASYMRSYDETKGTDPAEARKARKKALESLIDAATDRKNRAGETIYSLGSPVGIAFGPRITFGEGASYADRSAAYEDPDLSFDSLRWRVPLAFTRQRLPRDGVCCGTHVALTVGDLGQFARTNDDVTWRDFLSVGLQGGLVFGVSHNIVLAAEVSWTPSIYTHTTMIGAEGMQKPVELSGALSGGLTLAYYVPFFDFN